MRVNMELNVLETHLLMQGFSIRSINPSLIFEYINILIFKFFTACPDSFLYLNMCSY
jgi:hypothetical protein